MNCKCAKNEGWWSWCKHCGCKRVEVAETGHHAPSGVWGSPPPLLGGLRGAGGDGGAGQAPPPLSVGLQLGTSGWFGSTSAGWPSASGDIKSSYTMEQILELRDAQKALAAIGDVEGAKKYGGTISDVEEKKANLRNQFVELHNTLWTK